MDFQIGIICLEIMRANPFSNAQAAPSDVCGLDAASSCFAFVSSRLVVHVLRLILPKANDISGSSKLCIYVYLAYVHI